MFLRIARKNLLLLVLLLTGTSGFAQTDTLPGGWRVVTGDSAIRKDSLAFRKKAQQPEHSPKKAAILSACLPGAGQIYNGKPGYYWKVPVIYAGFGALTYSTIWNNRQYKIYDEALHFRYDDDSTTIDPLPRYTDNDLVTLKDYYRRYRDLSIIGIGALYALQIVDAAVDAHLYEFDKKMDGPLSSVNIRPRWISANNHLYPGIGITLGLH